MEQFSTMFLEFIASWGYFAIAILMAAENACIPVPSELILGFAGYLIFSGQLTFAGALTAGMIGGMAGSIFAYLVGHYGGRTGSTSMASRPCSSAACCRSCARSSRCRLALPMST